MGTVIDFKTGKPEANTFSKLFKAIEKLAADINVPPNIHDDFCIDVTTAIIAFACEQDKKRRKLKHKHNPKKTKKPKQ